MATPIARSSSPIQPAYADNFKLSNEQREAVCTKNLCSGVVVVKSAKDGL
jgi:hypothetical protein